MVGKVTVALSEENLSQSIVHWFLPDLFTLGGASVDWQLSPTPCQTTTPPAICVAHSFRRNATMLTHYNVSSVLIEYLQNLFSSDQVAVTKAETLKVNPNLLS